jgi:hypothetical protein
MAVLDVVVPFAAVILFALWELWRLRRHRPGSTAPRAPDREERS